MKVVILDNYDSFTYNLYQFIGEIFGKALVVRNDEKTFAEFKALEPDRIIISPGPGNPENPAYFGICKRVILEMGPTTPVLGVCLGHQGIIHAFGGRVVRAPQVMHGKPSLVYHSGQGIFKGIGSAFEGMRYHSLIGERETLPACLEITAATQDGIIMGVQHKTYPIYGIQVHPESIGTPMGKQILKNFLELSG
ncbi:MAG: aminodeoxychorismate/anthranilate synthase component II [Anaerolineales bacterium]|nr:aminodeoxychorismate/anthranilate synthase component II [Anaerolineales bacterium]